MRTLMALGLLLGACIRSNATTCDDGTLCPEGTVCAPAGERTLCATPEQLAACDERAAGDTCGSDRCYAIDSGLLCWPIECGNGFVDLPEREQCDDGNNASEDGCSADCFSNEQCGNGIIDSLFGERCDDGNIVSHDGCSSRCDSESARWVERIDRYITSARSAMTMTYDTRRARVVIFGGMEPATGSSSFFPTETIEWDGVFFEEISMTAPEGRADAAFAYDERRGVSVLFGGARETGFAADTWEWTGGDWRPIDARGPKGRAYPALVYDPIGDRMVLFGGRDALTDLSDTWQLQNGAWSQLVSEGPSPATSVSPATMTFDSSTGVIALVSGGVQWELDGETWTEIGEVPAITTQRMWLVYETSLGQRLLLGDDGSGMLRTWQWTGSAWMLLSRATTFAGSIRNVVADRARGGVIALRVPGWALWDAQGQLTLVDNPVFVDPRIPTGAAAANDLSRRVVVQFGGNLGDRTTFDLTDAMYVFDGRSWSESPVGKKPSPRWDHAMVYDPARDRIVLFGGETDAGLSGETWQWDGVAWSLITPTRSPTARAGHSMAFDPATNRVVLFGGRDEAGISNETWEWDGQTWTPRPSMKMPPPRLAAMFAQDPNGGGLILFGGATESLLGAAFDDTWRLTSAGWDEVPTVLYPTARRFSQLTWQPARRRLLLTGGERLDESGIITRAVVVGDTWEWDGARWRQLFSSPRTLTQHVAFASPDGTTVLTVGGNLLGVPGAERVFEHRWTDAGAYETCVSRLDADGDGRAACEDPDCWSVCTPLCLPGSTSCPMTPACGDSSCSSLETVRTCAADCGAAPVACGDFVCDPSETCAGDCL